MLPKPIIEHIAFLDKESMKDIPWKKKVRYQQKIGRLMYKWERRFLGLPMDALI